MSNFLAIATTTAALSQTLQAAVAADVPGASVTTARPEAPGSGATPARVNLYLYQITPNAAWRNADLPARGSNGRLTGRPMTALDLHYLLTFYGNEGQLEPQRLLGSVVRTLHAQPVLTRQMIQSVVNSPSFSFLSKSDLADSVELVKFTPIGLALEELSKLWSVFLQTPYTLSVAYQGTVVLIESEDTPQAALPVRGRNIYTLPFRQPVIEKVLSQAGADEPIVAGATLVLLGRQLRGDVTRVRLGELEVQPAEPADTQINVPLSSPPFPAGSLRAGVRGVQVVHQMLMGTPPAPHRGVESNVKAFVFHPTVQAVGAAPGPGPGLVEVTVTVNPIVGKTQRVVLLLNEAAGADPASYSFVAGPRTADSATVTFTVGGVKPANYLVRIQVDGAESQLTVDTNEASPTFNEYVDPKVTIP